MQAGYHEVSEKFGVGLTISNLANGVMSEEDKILQMPIGRVYTAIQRKAHMAAADRKYSEILTRKK